VPVSLRNDLRVRLVSTRTALRDRNLSRLMLSWGAWVTTDWAFLITVSVMALEVGGPAAVGLAGAVRVLPSALLGPVVAPLADRLPRPLVLMSVQGTWCVISLVMAWFAVAGFGLTALLIVVGIGSVVSSIYKTCIQALLPQLASDAGRLIVANSAFASLEAAGTVLGPALCGLLLLVAGPPVVFVVLAVVFAVGAVSGGTIRTPFQPARAAAGGGAAWRGMLVGFSLLGRRSTATVVAVIMGQTAMRGLINVFVILVATSVPGGDESLAGPLFAAMGVGGLIGSFVGLGNGGGRGGIRWFALGITLWGLPVAVIGLWTSSTVAWVALAVVGFGNAFTDIFGYSLLNRLFPDHLSGRAWGAFNSLGAGSVALGSAAAPLLVAAVGLSPAMIIVGLVLAAAPWLAWSGLRSAEASASARSEDFELFREVEVFAPLSLIAIERLATAATVVEVDAETTVVRQGDLGRDFYVVAEGELSVRQGDRELRRLGPRASFGEIALIDAVPRTASVVAVGPSRLLSLDSESFIAAVTGHRSSDELVRRTVDQHLAGDRERDEA